MNTAYDKEEHLVLSPAELSESETSREYALRYIRDSIVDLRFAPGSIISELNLAKQTELSRTPVREALIELAKTGIVEIQPKRANRVSLINLKVIEEAAFVRLAMDSAIIPEVCAKADAFDFEKLQKILTRQKEILERKDMDRDSAFRREDNEFHRCFYKICGRNLCYETAFSLNIHMERFRTLYSHYVSSEELLEEHRNILAAVRDQNIQKARDLTAKHDLKYKFDVDKVKKLYPDYFTAD